MLIYFIRYSMAENVCDHVWTVMCVQSLSASRCASYVTCAQLFLNSVGC